MVYCKINPGFLAALHFSGDSVAQWHEMTAFPFFPVCFPPPQLPSAGAEALRDPQGPAWTPGEPDCVLDQLHPAPQRSPAPPCRCLQHLPLSVFLTGYCLGPTSGCCLTLLCFGQDGKINLQAEQTSLVQ